MLILRPTDLVPPLASAPLALITFLAMVAAWLCSRRPILIALHATNKLALALLAIMIFATPFSYWRGLSVLTTVNYAKTVCLMILLVNLVLHVRTMAGVLWIVVVAHAPHAAMLIRNYLSGKLIADRAFGVAGGAFGDPNDLALDFVIVLPLTLWLLTRSRRGSARLLCLAMLVLLVAGVVASQSRGGLLGLLAVVALMILGSRHRLLIAAAAAGLGLFVVAAAPPQTWERIHTIRNYQADENAQNRLSLWRTGLQMWSDHPLTGVGPGAFPIAYGRQLLGSHRADPRLVSGTQRFCPSVGRVGNARLSCLDWHDCRRVCGAAGRATVVGPLRRG